MGPARYLLIKSDNCSISMRETWFEQMSKEKSSYQPGTLPPPIPSNWINPKSETKEQP